MTIETRKTTMILSMSWVIICVTLILLVTMVTNDDEAEVAADGVVDTGDVDAEK